MNSDLFLQHELFLELDAFDTRWQTRFKRIRDAAVAADCLGLYYLWLRTREGQRYRLEQIQTPPYDCVQSPREIA